MLSRRLHKSVWFARGHEGFSDLIATPRERLLRNYLNRLYMKMLLVDRQGINMTNYAGKRPGLLTKKVSLCLTRKQDMLQFRSLHFASVHSDVQMSSCQKYVNEQSSHKNVSVLGCFPEKSRWCSN